MKTRFVERTLRGFINAAEYAAAAERISGTPGLLQRADARMKLIAVLALIFTTVAAAQLRWLAVLSGSGVTLALLSRVSLRRLAGSVWAPVLFFTGVIAVPAIFLAPHGWRSAAFLVLRAETAATFAALLVLTTPWPKVLRALRVLCVPRVLVALLEMTERYIFLILRTAFDMMESRKSRTVAEMTGAERRRVAASSVAVLMSRSLQLSDEVHLAMQSRGFRGEVHLLDDPARVRPSA